MDGNKQSDADAGNVGKQPTPDKGRQAGPDNSGQAGPDKGESHGQQRHEQSAHQKNPNKPNKKEGDLGQSAGSWGWTSLGKSLEKSLEERSGSERPFEGAFSALLGGVSELSSQAVKFAARKTRDTTSKVFKNTPEQMELIGKAGTSLKDLREVAGVSIEDLSRAIELNDVDLLRSVEEGKAGLPFEVLLRLTSFYARNDPIPFIMKYSRIYSPRIWKMLHAVGLDKLVIQAERELQFVQIYRRKDAARKLSEEGFQEVLDFTRKSFDMALHFVSQQEQKSQQAEQDAAGEAETKKSGKSPKSGQSAKSGKSQQPGKSQQSGKPGKA